MAALMIKEDKSEHGENSLPDYGDKDAVFGEITEEGPNYLDVCIRFFNAHVCGMQRLTSSYSRLAGSEPSP